MVQAGFKFGAHAPEPRPLGSWALKCADDMLIKFPSLTPLDQSHYSVILGNSLSLICSVFNNMPILMEYCNLCLFSTFLLLRYPPPKHQTHLLQVHERKPTTAY